MLVTDEVFSVSLARSTPWGRRPQVVLPVRRSVRHSLRQPSGQTFCFYKLAARRAITYELKSDRRAVSDTRLVNADEVLSAQVHT